MTDHRVGTQQIAAQAETRRAMHALTMRLDALCGSSDECLALSARIVRARLRREAHRLDARAFDRLHFEIRDFGEALPMRERREWRGVEALASNLFCALVRQFRLEVLGRNGGGLRVPAGLGIPRASGTA